MGVVKAVRGKPVGRGQGEPIAGRGATVGLTQAGIRDFKSFIPEFVQLASLRESLSTWREKR